MDEVDIFELNEAFASQSCAVVKDLGIEQSKVIRRVCLHSYVVNICIKAFERNAIPLHFLLLSMYLEIACRFSPEMNKLKYVFSSSINLL